MNDGEPTEECPMRTSGLHLWRDDGLCEWCGQKRVEGER